MTDDGTLRLQRDSMIERIGFARFVLMNSTQLVLVDSQVTSIQRLDSLFHSIADTTAARLDSLHAQNAQFVAHVRQAPTDTPTVAQRDTLIARRKMIGQLSATLRTIQQDTRNNTLATLSSDQQTKIQTILTAAPDRGEYGRHGGSGAQAHGEHPQSSP